MGNWIQLSITNWGTRRKPSPSGRGLGEGESSYDAQRHITPRNPIVIPAYPHRHSRASGNPHPGLSAVRRQPGFWIPACAGMTVGGVRLAVSRAAQYDSPSPNPLPLGEGFLASARGEIPPTPFCERGAFGACAVYKVGQQHTALATLYRRGARPCAPTPHHETRPSPRNRPHYPPAYIQSPHPVIPAKAGIHTPALPLRRDIPGFWIPAGAGMTVGAGVQRLPGPSARDRLAPRQSLTA